MEKEPKESIKTEKVDNIINEKGTKIDNEAKRTAAKSDDLRFPNADEIYE